MNGKNCSSITLINVFFTMLLSLCISFKTISQPIYIEDVSPGPGSTPQSPPYASLWGKMLAVTATGLEGTVGPPTSWSSSNAGVIVDHIAAADKDGNLVLFYSYPNSDWKAVNVSEKTKAKIAIVRPESWIFPDGQIFLERLAAPSPQGDLLVFTWCAGSDWTMTNLSTTSKKIIGPVTSWNTPLGDKMVEHIGARSIENHFLVFWRIAGGEWAVVDVTALTGQHVGDSGTSWTQNLGNEWVESVAMPDLNDSLILFTFRPSTNWRVKNLSHMTNQNVGGRATDWIAPIGVRIEYLAAPAPNGDLVLFYTDPIDGGWNVLNITNITGQRVLGPVTNWNIQGGAVWWEHLGGRGNNDHLYVFFRPTGGTWQVKDITGTTNKTITQTPTSWITLKNFGLTSENIAAPSWDGHLHIFTFDPTTDWTTADVSLKAYGRIVYAASEMAGIWRSRDYGMNWMQMTRPQSNPDHETIGGLDVHLVLDVAASPVDPNLVLAATNIDHRNPSRTGIYRSTDGGELWTLVHQFECDNSVQPVTQIIFAPGDPTTLYAAGGCAIAISTNRGEKWDNVSLPGISTFTHVWHIAMSEMLPGEVRRGYACGDNILWYSFDSGKSWHIDNGTLGNLPVFGQVTGYGSYFSGDAPGILAVEPGQPNHVYLAIKNQANGSSFFHPDDGGPQGVRCNIPVIYDNNFNSVYDNGDEVIWRQMLDRIPPLQYVGEKLKIDTKLMFVDNNLDGIRNPSELVVYDMNSNGKYNLWNTENGEPMLCEGCKLPDIGTSLSYDENIKYMELGSPFGPCGTGAGSLWYGDFSSFDPDHPEKLHANWSQLPGNPVYWGGSTTSGRVFVVTHKTKNGYLLFFSNRESIHVSVGKPTEGSWHRLDALDASASKRLNKENTFLVHVDPHALTISPDFDLTLKKVLDLPYPYNQNMELDQPVLPTTAIVPSKEICQGRIWICNDGGVYLSDDCGQHWIPAQSGLSTLASHNIAGVSRVSTIPGELKKPPALYFGTGDNDDFFSLDGGKIWNSAYSACGDCDVWYTDPAQPDRVWRHPPRAGKGAFELFVNPNGGAPDAANLSQLVSINYPDPPSGSTMAGIGNALFGGRPIVQTLADEAPLPDGDYIAIQKIIPQPPTPDSIILIRAENSVKNLSPWIQVGPKLPSSVSIVQASGGHAATIFYLGDETNLWKSHQDNKGKVDSWQQIVPHGDVIMAKRFFVNPYNSKEIYILDQTTVHHSTDGGITWPIDAILTSQLTDQGVFQCDCNGTICVMNDMIFDRNSTIRFALGLAGVFYSGDGTHWLRLVDTRALPSRPRGAFFDSITDPKDPSLYIAFEGRGIMRCHPIPSLSK